MTTAALPPTAGKRSAMQRVLDGIEKLGNKVPHPAIIFLALCALVIVGSHVLYLFNVGVAYDVVAAEPVVQAKDYYEDSAITSTYTPADSYAYNFQVEQQSVKIQSLLTTEGIRFLFTSFVLNFANFSVVAVTFVAMMGAGVAEEAGMMGALIRKLVKVSPRRLIAFIIIFVGVLSSVATDAGYLILIPLGAAAFLSMGRHPLAGMAAAYAGVGAAFGVNLLITPVDGMLTEITNEAIHIAAPGVSLNITANYFFAVASSILLAIVATVITERLVEPRLGKYEGKPGEEGKEEETPVDEQAEARGLRWALYFFLGAAALVALITLPPGSALRHPETGAIVGDSPFMDSLIFIISMLFLISGIGYGIGAKTFKNSNDVIKGITKTFAGLSGLVFMLLIISQFIAYFNYSNMPTVVAVTLADLLEQANIGPVLLLVGMILVIALLDIIIPGVVPKWAIFAPVFIPLFMRLGVAPQTVLAAYRVGDSPLNVVTPLMVYLPFMVLVAQRYQKGAGIGTITALMLPFAGIMLVVWILFFVLWFVLGIPLGPGYPVAM